MAELFVAVLGASTHTYAEATWSQKLPDWIGAHVRMFARFGKPIQPPVNAQATRNRAKQVGGRFVLQNELRRLTVKFGR